MSEGRVRLGCEPVVHGARTGGWTACGVMYGEPPGSLHESVLFMSRTPTDDPIDCMACLVQETRGPTDTLRIRGTITLPVPIHVITLVIELEPDE
jgi:hypothetical protein